MSDYVKYNEFCEYFCNRRLFYNISNYNAFNINGSDYSDNMGVFSPEFAEAISEEQNINLPVKFYNSVYISSDAAQRIPNGSDESLWTLNIINPILVSSDG